MSYCSLDSQDLLDLSFDQDEIGDQFPKAPKFDVSESTATAAVTAGRKSSVSSQLSKASSSSSSRKQQRKEAPPAPETKPVKSQPAARSSSHHYISPSKRMSSSSKERQILDLSLDNTIMREKLDRMHEISAENLLLQSDVADYHAELTELRGEAKDLRAKCYELIEDNRICKAEVRDLRRYIDLQKANKSGDTRQDLLNKIEYYQMEHDRLLDEVRRLKHRLGDLSPRRSRESSPPRSRHHSPRIGGDAGVGGKVRFDESADSREGGGAVCDAIAASTASSQAASRLVKDRRNLSPSAILNLRDLTIERYKSHLARSESASSIASDNTEILLKGRLAAAAATATSSGGDEESEAAPPSDEEDLIIETADAQLEKKLRERHRTSTRGCRSPASSYRNGFRSLSPRMTSTQNGVGAGAGDVKDTARDRYPTMLKRSLPRRAFAPRSPADLRLGYAIKFTRPGGKLSRGTVRYIGHLPTRTEIFIGVELDGTDGKHTGTFQGTKYFSCPSNKGIFTPFSKVIMAWE